MINNKLAMQECIGNNSVIICTDTDGWQWITDGRSMYKLFGMPRMTPDRVLSVMGIRGKKAETIFMDEREMPSIFCYDELGDEDEEILLPNWTMKAMGTELWITKVGERVMGISTKALKPCEDKHDEYTRLYFRQTKSGGAYVRVMDGYDLIAILAPVPLRGMGDELRKLAYQVQQLGVGA